MKKIFIIVLLFLNLVTISFSKSQLWYKNIDMLPQDHIYHMQKIAWLEEVDPELQQWITLEKKDKMSE